MSPESGEVVVVTYYDITAFGRTERNKLESLEAAEFKLWGQVWKEDESFLWLFMETGEDECEPVVIPKGCIKDVGVYDN